MSHKKAKAARKTNNQSGASDARPYSTRDEVYESIMGYSAQDSQMGGDGHQLPPAEREIVLGLMIKNLKTELETLKAEAVLNHDKQALECLHTMAFESTQQLLKVSSYIPDLVAEIARHESVWPVLYGPAGIAKRTADDLIKTLEVGAQCSSNLDLGNVLSEISETRKWLAIILTLMNRIREESIRVRTIAEQLQNSSEQEATLATALLEACKPNSTENETIEHLKKLVLNPDEMARLAALFKVQTPFRNSEIVTDFVKSCVALPVLTGNKEAVDSWMQVIRQLLMDVYDGHPEKSVLGPLGVSLAESKKDWSKPGTASYDSNKRAGIFRSIKIALSHIAKV